MKFWEWKQGTIIFYGINATVNTKSKQIDLYLNWNAFTFIVRKSGTLCTLTNIAYEVGSNREYLNEELEHLQNVDHIQNGYPIWLIKQIMKEIRACRMYTTSIKAELENKQYKKQILPFKGAKGNTIIKAMNNNLKWYLPDNTYTCVACITRKLSTKFHWKDQTNCYDWHYVSCRFSLSCS